MDRQKHNALERLALVEPWDLCSEAKVEKCRAMRDLRSCGRVVQHHLISCGHACLCMECCQRCDVCPICHMPVPTTEPKVRLRLYEECVAAGLVQNLHAHDAREMENEGNWTEDIGRLYSLFDIALENNLVSLICHYVIDVCMDEGAVSSDAVVSMLLDGTIVKEWCKRTFTTIARTLQNIYNVVFSPPKNVPEILDQHAQRLQGLTHVLETLEAPLSLGSGPLIELRQLLESAQRVLQHLEVMAWCLRHHFLEGIKCSHASFAEWRARYNDRQVAASERAWPDCWEASGWKGTKPQTSLFIDDAMSNLDIGNADCGEYGRELGMLCQEQASYSGSVSRIEEEMQDDRIQNCYPPENVRAAVDMLFLKGRSDLILAKKAIFLYYLFDRHWTTSDARWENIIEDYACTFSIPRQVKLESFIFYLLDENTDNALQRACDLLPEVVSPSIHPNIARILLEREKPDVALSVLRCSGQDGWLDSSDEKLPKTMAVPLSVAVTAVRVRLECELLTEAYLYQKSYWKRVRAETSKQRLNDKDQDDWQHEMGTIVGEFCWMCIRKGQLEHMIKLPWNLDEEKVINKCLLEKAAQDPCYPAGSFLVIFYIQRCRYLEAYSVHQKVCQLENQFLVNCSEEERVLRVKRAHEYRTSLIEKFLALLPEVERQERGRSNSSFCLNGISDFYGYPGHIEMEGQKSSLPHTIEQKIPLVSRGENSTIPSPLLVHHPSESTKAVKRSGLSHKGSNGSVTRRDGFEELSMGHGKSFETQNIVQMDSPWLERSTTPRKYKSPGLSPLLGRRLRYEVDSVKF